MLNPDDRPSKEPKSELSQVQLQRQKSSFYLEIGELIGFMERDKRREVTERRQKEREARDREAREKERAERRRGGADHRDGGGDHWDDYDRRDWDRSTFIIIITSII